MLGKFALLVNTMQSIAPDTRRSDSLDRDEGDASCAYIDTVMNQNPSAGSTANWGSAVNITLGVKSTNKNFQCN
jgi:beta-lactam-binding protein with PASTA domain